MLKQEQGEEAESEVTPTRRTWISFRARKAVTDLANTDDLRAVGALTEALALGEPSYSLVVSVLTRLLPRLQPSDAEMLTDAQRARLQRTLRQSADRLVFWRYNPHFAAVLRRALTTLDALPPEEQAAGAESLERTEAHPHHVEALLEQFQAAVRQRQKNTLTIGASASLAAGSAVGNLVAQTLTHQQGNTPLLGIAIGSMAITFAYTFRGLSRLKAMMNELAGADDLRVVGPLLEIASIEDGHANTMAAHLLTRLLPRLKASDTSLLTESQHAALGRTLTRNVKNADFLIAALAALEQVGDGRALPVVESLASGRVVTADPFRVRGAAQDCLPYLQTRYAQQQASQTLLRASALSEAPTDTLLRPAQGVADTEPAELLRPGTPVEESKGEQSHHEFRSSLAAFSGDSLVPVRR